MKNLLLVKCHDNRLRLFLFLPILIVLHLTYGISIGPVRFYNAYHFSECVVCHYWLSVLPFDNANNNTQSHLLGPVPQISENQNFSSSS